ncbi:MAG: sialate O-acetylesterase [Chitinophagaceae bacterium]|nr:sialate O-acetylesterase [Chitinophagaceae bacterium]
MGKRFFVFACFLVCVLTGDAQDKEVQYSRAGKKKNFHIFLLMGQSNMAGYGCVVESDPWQPGDKESVPGVWALTGQHQLDADTSISEVKWIPAKHPLHVLQSSAQFGMGIDFAREYIKLHPGVTVGLIPCAWGGASINWLNKGTSHYANAIMRARLAAKDGVIMGVLWHQGESDSVTPELAALYQNKLDRLVMDVRKDLSNSRLAFVCGDLAEFYGQGRSATHKAGIPIIRRTLHELPLRLPYTYCVATDGLKSPDEHYVHFDRWSNIQLGRRYAQAFKILLR